MMRILARSLAAVWLIGCADGPTGPAIRPDPATLALGNRHACVVWSDGTRCWGRGVEGQTGVGTTPADTTPALVQGAPVLTSLTLGQTHSCGLALTGQAWCWGSNQFGELGHEVPDVSCGVQPCRPVAAPTASAYRFRVLVAGLSYTCGLALDGRVYCWGLNDTGQLGNTAVVSGCGVGCSAEPVLAAGGKRFRSLIGSLSHVCGLDTAGKPWCWGYDALPIPGGHPNPSFLPAPREMTGVPPLTSLVAGGYHTCGLTHAGEAWCWGIDALGAGPTTLESAEPVRVSGGHHFVALAAARFTTCGLENGGAVYCWGPNGSGEVGVEPVGSTQRFDVPVRISGSHLFQSIRGGGSTYCGMTTTGQVACWGRGTEGELGSGHSNSTVPVVVPLD